MKREIFLEILNGIEISNDVIESAIADVKSIRLTEEQHHSLTEELEKLNAFIEALNPKILYELWELDSVCNRLLEKIDILPIDNIDNARIIAMHLSRNWCTDEEPHKKLWGDDELWIGNSDFGILIRKVKENLEE